MLFELWFNDKKDRVNKRIMINFFCTGEKLLRSLKTYSHMKSSQRVVA